MQTYKCFDLVSEIPTDKPAVAGVTNEDAAYHAPAREATGKNGVQKSPAQPVSKQMTWVEVEPAQLDYIPARLDSEMGPVMRAFHEARLKERTPYVRKNIETAEDLRGHAARVRNQMQEQDEREELAALKRKYEK